MRTNREAKMQDAPSRKVKESPICYIIVGLVALSCFLPLWIAFVASVSDEAAVIEKGFSLWPRNFTLDTYKVVHMYYVQMQQVRKKKKELEEYFKCMLIIVKKLLKYIVVK